MKFCTECGARLLERNKFCCECGAKISVAVMNESDYNTRQIQPFSNNQYRSESTMENGKQQDIEIQDVEMSTVIECDNINQVQSSKIVEEMSAVVNVLNTDEETENIKNDLEFKDNADDIQQMNEEQSVNIIDDLKKEVAETLAEDIVQETQKEDI